MQYVRASGSFCKESILRVFFRGLRINTFEKVFSRVQMRTRSIIEFANTVYCIHTIFIGTIYYTRLLQTSEQSGDKNTAISSNAQLATSAEREVPRATCNERKARSSPRNLQQARSAKFPAQLATSAEREVPRATCNKRGARSSPRRNREYFPSHSTP